MYVAEPFSIELCSPRPGYTLFIIYSLHCETPSCGLTRAQPSRAARHSNGHGRQCGASGQCAEDWRNAEQYIQKIDKWRARQLQPF